MAVGHCSEMWREFKVQKWPPRMQGGRCSGEGERMKETGGLSQDSFTANSKPVYPGALLVVAMLFDTKQLATRFI